MQSIHRRLRKVEQRSEAAGFRETDGWSDERIMMEMQRYLRIIYRGVTTAEGMHIQKLISTCTPDEFSRVWAAKQARDDREGVVVTSIGIDGQHEVSSSSNLSRKFRIELGDFRTAGILDG